MLLEKILHTPFYFSNGKPISTWFGNRIIFITVHRVRKNDYKGDSFNDFIDITTDNLEKIIIHLKKNNVRFVSLSELEEKPVDNQIRVHFTVDDGYKDILENGLPLFEKYKVPFTLFLATGIPDREAVLWWYVNAEILNRNQNLIIERFGINIHSGSLSLSQKKNVFESLRQLFLENYGTHKQEMDTALNASGVRTLEITEQTGMSWNEIHNLKQSGLCSFGLHTHHHFRFSSISASVAEEEIKHCYDRIFAETNIKSPYFAYPFGGVKDRQPLMQIKEVPLSHCFITDGGIIKSITAKNRYHLPRYFINNNTTGYSLNMIINGMRYYTNKLLYP